MKLHNSETGTFLVVSPMLRVRIFIHVLLFIRMGNRRGLGAVKLSKALSDIGKHGRNERAFFSLRPEWAAPIRASLKGTHGTQPRDMETRARQE
jgi:hypothetical protein